MSYMVPGNPSSNVTHANQQPTNSQPQKHNTHKLLITTKNKRASRQKSKLNRTRKNAARLTGKEAEPRRHLHVGVRNPENRRYRLITISRSYRS